MGAYVSSCKNRLFPSPQPPQSSPFHRDSSKEKCPISPLKSPSLLPCAGDDSSRKGFNYERNRLLFGINFACRTFWKGKKTEEKAEGIAGEMRLRRVPLVLKNTLFLPHFSPKLPPNHPQNVPQFSPFQGDALAEKSLNLSPFTPRTPPVLTPGQAEICSKKYGIFAKSTMF